MVSILENYNTIEKNLKKEKDSHKNSVKIFSRTKATVRRFSLALPQARIRNKTILNRRPRNILFKIKIFTVKNKNN